MVEGSPSYRKWKRDNPPPSIFSDRDRCLRVGYGLPRNQDWGPVVSSGAATAHQCARAQGRHVCGPGFHKGPTEDPCSPKDGQHIGPGLYQTNGRNPVPEFDESDLRDVGLVSPEGYHPFRISPTRNKQPDSRLGVQGSANLSRVEAQRKIISQDLHIPGPMQNRLVATRLNAQLDNYISWNPDPGAMLTDAFQTSWKELEGYAFLPFPLIGRCLQKVRAEQSTIVLVAPVWRNQVWFPMLLDLAVELHLLLAHRSDLLLDSKDQPHPLVCTNRLRLAAWKISSNNTQQQEFQKKLQPCYLQDGAQAPTLLTKLDGNSRVAGVREGRLIPFHVEYNLSCGIQPFLEFITSLFKEGLEYHTINLIRSAVSSTRESIEGTPIGQHPLVKQLFKEVYNSRPLQPRYTSTWDVN